MASSSARLAGLALAAAVAGLPATAVGGEKAENPFLGEGSAVSEGRTIYRTRCYICHLSNGGRGPNLFASKLTPTEFASTVAAGRNTMPALGAILSAEEIWKVHAFIKSTDRYE